MSKNLTDSQVKVNNYFTLGKNFIVYIILWMCKMIPTMAKFTEHEDAFLNAIIYHINKEWKGEKGKFANTVGISGSYISFIIGRKKCPIVEKQEKIAKKLGYKSLADFIDFGKNLTQAELATVLPAMQMSSSALPAPHSVIDLKTEADKKHASVIAGFENKELALEVNQILLELEKRDPSKLVIARDMLNGLLAGTPVQGATSKKGHLNGTEDVK